jgi:hypothetical protein
MKKYIKWATLVLGGLFLLVALTGLILYPLGIKKLTQKYPNIVVERINIPGDADAIARGRHIITIWACGRCHGEDLSGMVITNDPLSGIVPLAGAIPAPNLTSGRGGIGQRYTDTDWVRAIRHGVKPNGHVEAFMFDYSTMSNQDLGDLLTYLKQIPPVNTNYSEMRYGPIIPVVSNIGLLAPAAERIDHNAPRPPDPIPGATVEYGRYLSTICTACHGSSIVNTVNKWSQDEFIQTFHTGVLSDGKQFGPIMSSNTFREMTDTELSALWLYFTKSRP